MCKVAERERSAEQAATGCAHPLALDRFDGTFGRQLRRLSCLKCGQGWWESEGAVIGSTRALGVLARLVDGPRPTGWSAADREWQYLREESLVPRP
jgi:hypothetical protein